MDGIHLDVVGNDNHEHGLSDTEADPIHELQTALHVSLIEQVENLEIGNNFEIPSYDGISSDVSTGSGDCNLDPGGPIATSSKRLQKCCSFPVAVKKETTTECQPEGKSCKRSQSLPTEHKLVSALKGSREQEGVAPRKLSVSWGFDVYDPPPTSLSHFPEKKTQLGFKYFKKHGKGKQKGKSIRGGGSDKKHHRKMGGRSDKYLKSFADSDRFITSSNKYSSRDILDLNDDTNIGSSDSNCSSKLLGQAGGTMHCVY